VKHTHHPLIASVLTLAALSAGEATVPAGDAPAPAAAPSAQAAADLAAMQGRWALMSWQDDGYEVTAGKGPDMVIIEGDRLTYRRAGHDQSRMVLDPERQPLILAGGEAAGFVHGRAIAFNGQAPLAPVKDAAPPPIKPGADAVSLSDLLRTISERMGAPAAGFGESRRALNKLLA
jgi:uncharacterized protein (TIGR03067 family)